ncbi:SRPBCC family protein [Mycobacterium sp.]|uniref:SRPBCC family protein n=1 Tax=Mycobacterium sp. TaxID=1785 RepID=UPI002C3E76AC|nr:SRPBCC family protein [Mycobacterium sp.]HME49178.1 SRPBCC family protein [Mycobacterium sp.]
MPIVSKTVEVTAAPETIMSIVADFESYPQWNEEIKGCWVLARYDDGRPSQLRLDVEIQGQSGTFICAVYYPSPSQIYTLLQQGDFFDKQQQTFSVVGLGASSLLTVDLDVETKLAIPKMMVKKMTNDLLDYLADNLKKRAEQLAANW